jgi:hypothetical protein
MVLISKLSWLHSPATKYFAISKPYGVIGLDRCLRIDVLCARQSATPRKGDIGEGVNAFY